jgi:8-oxo-dGTP pyrophosphatase MutT (NUDIX family)
VVGSVARSHLAALRAWPEALDLTEQGVSLKVPAPARDAALAQLNAALRGLGLIRAWRDEIFAIVDPADGRHLARTERAAARFWGTLTLGAHATGYVADAMGRPAQLWVAQRSATKATDPGLFDNLIGGGVPAGQTPHEALLREGWEEAGLGTEILQAARPARVIRLERDIPEGFQFEDLHCFDLALPPGLVPCNQDGEVQRFEILSADAALACAAGPSMTVDAALVTLDFALRHGLVTAGQVGPQAETLFGCAVGGHQSR